MHTRHLRANTGDAAYGDKKWTRKHTHTHTHTRHLRANTGNAAYGDKKWTRKHTHTPTHTRHLRANTGDAAYGDKDVRVDFSINLLEDLLPSSLEYVGYDGRCGFVICSSLAACPPPLITLSIKAGKDLCVRMCVSTRARVNVCVCVQGRV